MVSARGLWYKDQKTGVLLRLRPEEQPAAFQLFGSEPEIMAHAAAQLDGAENVLIDINMGCPVPKVTKNGDGSALMKNPDLAGRIVEAMVAKTKKPVTVKMRAGWDENDINAVAFAKTVVAAGAAAVTVHGRTRAQYYKGKADWSLIAKVKAAVSVPVVGNGDVMNGADAIRMLEETGCDLVMIARGALGNPWIFQECLLRYEGADEEAIRLSSPDSPARAEMFLRHACLVRQEKGADVALREMRKHVGWYFKGDRGVTTLKNTVNRIGDFETLFTEIEAFTRGYLSCNERGES
jgi:tRNA-dihydrouridine synthase B